MKRSVLRLVGLLLAAAASLVLSGCSLIGLGIGALSDASKPDEVSIPGWKVETIKPGSQVTLILRDGRRIFGRYAGTAPLPAADYARRYAECLSRLPEGVFLPALGDTVTVVLTNGERLERTFAGFDARHLLFTGQAHSQPARLSLKAVRTIQDSQGHLLKAETAIGLLAGGQIPIASQMVVQTSEGEKPVALEQVQLAQVPAKKRGKLAGFVIGAAVDAIVVAVAVTSRNEPRREPVSEDYQFSCPFVYSFDGERYRLDSETFGGAIFRAAQRADLDNLDHLREVHGTYRLKLTNELRETQYVDAIKLLVVDHPRGTEVVPSFSGDLHVFSAPQLPVRAVDLGGSDVLELVGKKDGDFWISNPLGHNPAVKSQVRDGVIVEFERPAGATQVKLALNVQNTLWASYLQGQMLELHGRDLENWYALMNRSAVARQTLQQVMVREGMLLIKVWNGEGWQPAGFVWEVGPSLPKDQAVLLDINDLPGDTLRVMLESTAGLWMINSVVADYTPNAPVQVTELDLSTAVDQSGRDLLELLGDEDGRYYVMPQASDWAELTFAAPPRHPDLARSFVLKATGYYTIHVAASGEPQTDAIRRFMSEPGAYGQYTLRLLNRQMSMAMAALEKQ